MAATALKTEELAIDMSEGDAFMKAAQNVMRHYSIESSQKTIDWLAFGGTCAMIYGTRFGAYMLRKREEKIAQRPPATVYQMPVRQTAPTSPKAPAPQSQPQAEAHIMPEAEFEAE